MRKVDFARKTSETDIKGSLNLDGKGLYDIETGCGFFNHMMELFAKHGGFDVTLRCDGDLRVDGHHTVEDCGITLGKAFKDALGDKKGINRYGSFIMPMDEALILVAVDFSGRSYVGFDVKFPDEYKLGDMDTELIHEFMLAFARSAELTLHVREICGENNHHVAEGEFKGLARALRQAVAVDEKNGDVLPSTKGVL